MNVDSDVAPSETVSGLLVTGVGAAYWVVAACDALNVTVPALCSVITPVLALMVATLGLLLSYTIAPSLALFGAGAVIANGDAPYVFSDGTVNVDSVGTAVATGTTNATPLLLIPSPPYRVYVVLFITALVVLVYVPFVSLL